MWGGTEEAASIRAIQAAVDSGITLIDTAPAYGLGLSEEVVGKAIRGRRDRVVIATKCGLVWHTQRGNRFFDQDGKPVHRYLGADSIRHEIEGSLRRLGVETIDLYQTHWQDPTTPIAETMGALLDLKREGKIRAIGVSNATPQEMDEYRRAGPLDTDQEKYSMLDREPERELLPYLRRHGIAFLAYSPLALGLLTGKIRPDRQFSGDDLRRGDARFRPENVERINAELSALDALARGHGAGIGQIAIAWTLAQPGVTHALMGARTAEQAEENARAGAIALDSGELARIGEVVDRLAPFTASNLQ